MEHDAQARLRPRASIPRGPTVHARRTRVGMQARVASHMSHARPYFNRERNVWGRAEAREQWSGPTARASTAPLAPTVDGACTRVRVRSLQSTVMRMMRLCVPSDLARVRCVRVSRLGGRAAPRGV